ncbi:Pentatricopeptide repeat-containing protein At5g16860 [Dionaea muscipula]
MLQSSLPRTNPSKFKNHLLFFSTSPPAPPPPTSPVPPIPLSPSVFRQCSSLPQAKLLHQQVLVQGLLTHLSKSLISAYISCISGPSHAVTLLARLSTSSDTLFSWNAVIRHYASGPDPQAALRVFSLMRRLGWEPDCFSFPFALKACGEIGSLSDGELLHGAALVCGLDANVFVGNATVAMYGKCGHLGAARKVFDGMTERGVYDLVSWNSIMAACVQNGDFESALKLLQRMNCDFGVCPDAVSLAGVLPACAGLCVSMKGREVHGLALRNGMFENVFVGNALVDMYAKCGMMEKASHMFEKMKVKDVVSWNSMVTGYAQVCRFDDALHLLDQMKQEKVELDIVTWSAVIAGYAQTERGYEALDVFRRMWVSGSKPNVVTFVSLLSGCASVGALLQGMESHCYAIKHLLNQDKGNLGSDLMIINGLIDMYSKCKDFEMAHSIFDLVLPKDRNVVTWTVMIGGYAQHGEANKALKLFFQMMHRHQEGTHILPNAFTMSCVLMACARLGTLRMGKQIHAYILRNNFEPEVLYVSNCLIDMYSKSGDIDSARILFDNMTKRNAVSWTSLLAGYGMHGRGEEALDIFEEMRRACFYPDGVTFLVLLYACSHSGLTDHGIRLFNNMASDFGVDPGVEHYACVVDLLGRAGRLHEAMKLIEEMPMKPGPVVWIALLSSCRIHANVDLGEYAAGRLSELKSENDGTYTLLSNLYASARRWKDVARIRYLSKHSGFKKRPGCSWVQGKERTEIFYVGDWSHPESRRIHDVLSDLIRRIKAMGYVPQTSFALHDVDDEEKGDVLFEHSEKLALAYAILYSSPGATIRITKNLRVCGDCHLAITYISKIVDNEIILRDSSRFHHFNNGSCSCKGYW